MRQSNEPNPRDSRNSRSENQVRKQEEVQLLTQTRRRRKQAEDRRLKTVEQERAIKEDIEKSEDKRNQLLKLIQLELEREARLEKEKNYLKSQNKFKKAQTPAGGINPQLQSHKDRAVQLASSIQNTKDIIAATKIRLDHEMESRNKVETRLRRVRSEMTRAKIKQNRSFRTKAPRKI